MVGSFVEKLSNKKQGQISRNSNDGILKVPILGGQNLINSWVEIVSMYKGSPSWDCRKDQPLLPPLPSWRVLHIWV